MGVGSVLLDMVRQCEVDVEGGWKWLTLVRRSG